MRLIARIDIQRDFDRECLTVVIVSIECTDAKLNRHNQSEAFVDRAIDNEKGDTFDPRSYGII